MKEEIWVNVEMSADNKSAFISDMSHWMQGWFVNEPRKFRDYEHQFVSIKGKFLTVNVMGLGKSYERCKSFAIWYVANRESIRTYRLD
jgi:hypothetical protein